MDAAGIDPQVFAEVIETWTKGQLACRARQRHNWGPYTAYVNARTADVHEVCGLCKNRRHRLMNALTGQWIDPKWRAERFGPDYLLPKGVGRLSVEQKDYLRLLEVMSRKITYVDEE